jgi:uncharacterized repeat protein (TIGR03806 family)
MIRALVLTLGIVAFHALHAQVPPRDPLARLQIPTVPGSFGYTFENAFPGLAFASPVVIVTPPGETNRLFIVEQAGRIRVIPNLANPTAETFLDLVSSTVSGGEQGVLGLAFHPEYASNGRFFVFRTCNARTSPNSSLRLHNRLSEFKISPLNGNRAATNETILFQQYDEASNHNGGDLHFGPDGFLYVALGDEGAANDSYRNSQRIDRDFFSAILRIDVDHRPGSLLPNTHAANRDFLGNYHVPADNPYHGRTNFLGVPVNPSLVRTEFYSIGWRNPWRMSFDRDTGELWVADVGQSLRESIAITRLGANHGWGYREGNVPGPFGAPVGFTTDPAFAYVPPLYAYTHGSGPMQGNSVTGGFVYRGSRLAQLHGAYIFSDYVRGNVWTLRRRPGLTPLVQRIAGQGSISGFGPDPRNGDVLAAHHTGNRILRLNYNATFSGAPLPPTLADTGAFTDTAQLQPIPAFVPYEVNLPFWSDHASKQRWVFLPGTERAGFSPDAAWTTPSGTVWMKHFDIELTRGNPATRRRLETRFLVRNASGVHGITYRWNSPTNAVLVDEAGEDELLTIQEGDETKTQLWRYPSRAECLACHTAAAGGSLSFNTPQLNRPGRDGNHQIAALAQAGYLDNTPPLPSQQPSFASFQPGTDAPASLESRVRAYLDANCAPCHQPGGTGGSPWDARASTPLDLAGILNGPLNDSRGNPAHRVIVPGQPSLSVLLQRLSSRGPGQMPPIGSNVPDTAGSELLQQWILSLTNRVDFPTWAQLRLNDPSSNPPRDRDSDADGASDYLEYLTGTDPIQPEDSWRPSITLENGQASLTIHQPANVAFRIESSTAWPPIDWNLLAHPANSPFFPAEARDLQIPIPDSEAIYLRVSLWIP